MSEVMTKPSKEAREAISKLLDTLARRYSFFFKQADEDLLWELMESFAVKARLVGSTQTLEAFEDEYCKHDEPMRGVVLGVKAMNAVRAALEKAGK